MTWFTHLGYKFTLNIFSPINLLKCLDLVNRKLIISDSSGVREVSGGGENWTFWLVHWDQFVKLLWALIQGPGGMLYSGWGGASMVSIPSQTAENSLAVITVMVVTAGEDSTESGWIFPREASFLPHCKTAWRHQSRTGLSMWSPDRWPSLPLLPGSLVSISARGT